MSSSYEYRELAIREAILLLIRSLINTFPLNIKKSNEIKSQLSFALIYLQTKVINEENLIVIETSKYELIRLSILNNLTFELSDENSLIEKNSMIIQLISDNYQQQQEQPDNSQSINLLIELYLCNSFEFILTQIMNNNIQIMPNWTSNDIAKSAFEVNFIFLII